MSGLLNRFEYRSRAIIVALTLAVVAVSGIVDYATGWELSFAVLYLIALGLAAWFVNKRFALLIAVLSVAVSLAGNLATGQRYSNEFAPWWNAFILLIFYVVVLWLLARLRLLYEELEARVKQRTAALTDEMAERKRVERELLAISEREQRRIGHDLHDSLGQHLTGMALAGQVLQEKLASRNLPEAADAGKVIQLAEEAIVLSRKLAKGLHPIEMEAAGLMQALEELAATSSDLFKVFCRFECDVPVLIPDAAISGHLYRIAQEAVSNAVKHGKARNVVIQLETLDDGIALRVKDDGVGLPDPSFRNAGMGLRIIAHRADMIGAAFEARRDETGGTTVACVLRAADDKRNISRE